MKAWLRGLLPYLTSIVVHAVALGGLAAGTLFVARKILAPPPLEVELVVRPKVVEEPEEKAPKERKNVVDPPPDAPPPPKPRRRKPKPQKILVEPPAAITPTRVASFAQPPPQPSPPMRADEPARPGPPAPTVFGLDMDSADSAGGTFEVAQGNTVATSPANTGPVLGERGRPPGGELIAPPAPIPPPEDDTKITTWPARKDDLVFRYPEDARKLGTEGAVKLRLSLDARGHVVDARLVQAADPLLDKTALESVAKLRFSPAFAGKKPVPCEIPYTFTFVLD